MWHNYYIGFRPSWCCGFCPPYAAHGEEREVMCGKRNTPEDVRRDWGMKDFRVALALLWAGFLHGIKVIEMVHKIVLHQTRPNTRWFAEAWPFWKIQHLKGDGLRSQNWLVYRIILVYGVACVRGWGGVWVGWGGLIAFPCTCTWCYATGCLLACAHVLDA